MEMCLIHPALGISNVMVRTGDEGGGGGGWRIGV